MITDANGMPVLQPLVDDASTATFNAAFAQIGSVVSGVTPGITTYRWTSQTAQNNQTGMVEGSIGYRTDTDIYYTYTGSAWTYLISRAIPVTLTLASGITATSAQAFRTGSEVHMFIFDAQRTAAWTSGTTVATVGSSSADRPPGTLPAFTIQGATGAPAVASVQASGTVAVYGASGSGNSGRVSIAASWIAL